MHFLSEFCCIGLRRGRYFAEWWGILVMASLGDWLVGFCCALVSCFQCKCQHLLCRISRILVLYFKCLSICIDNGWPITGQLQVDVLPPEIWFKYWSWLWEWLVRYSNRECMHQVCEVCMDRVIVYNRFN